MKIGNAVQTAGINQMQNNNSKDKVMNGLMKQISNIQGQMQKLNENDKMSMEQRTEKRNQLQKQLSELNEQVSARQMEMQKRSMEKIQRKISAKSVQSAQANLTKEQAQLSSLNGILSAGANLSQMNAMNAVRVKSQGEARVLTTEIQQDGARGVDTSAKQERLNTVEGGLKDIAETLSNKASEITDNIAKNAEQLSKVDTSKENEKTDGNTSGDKKITGNSEDVKATKTDRKKVEVEV